MHAHDFTTSVVHPDYEVCSICNTYHNINPLGYEDAYATNYWDGVIKSDIHSQVHNLTQIVNGDGVSKVDAVLKYAKPGNMALEIACSPGALLRCLGDLFDKVAGVEYNSYYFAEIQQIAGDKPSLIGIPFPDATSDFNSESVDFIVAMDFLEHMEDGQSVINEVYRILKPGSVAVFMAPIFGINEFGVRPQDFHPEHRWLYSSTYLTEWLSPLFKIEFDHWADGHSLIILTK